MMPEEKRTVKMPHNVILEDRKKLSVTGVEDIDSFDEGSITVYTALGELTVTGIDLHINRLSVETGELLIEGDISAFKYTEGRIQKEGFFSRLFH